MLGRVAYEISNGLTAGVNISYDEAFETRVSADIEVRFGGATLEIDRRKVEESPVMAALISAPRNRNLRIHDDKNYGVAIDMCIYKDSTTLKRRGRVILVRNNPRDPCPEKKGV